MMLDDLRNSATFEEEPQPPEETEAGRPLPRRQNRQPFLGMSPAQRFVIAILVFLMTCVLSAFCLLLTESVYLPFF